MMDEKKENKNHELAAFKSILLETMVQFDSFCKQHSIRYFGVGGTAIGAIRHKGFIPWDDDIDVCILREDYDRFIGLKNQCAGTGYTIIDYHDKGNPATYAKFINMNTTLVEFDYNPYSSGVFIDVFPLDNVPDRMDDAISLKEKVMNNVMIYQKSSFDLCWSDIFKYIKQGHLNSVLKALMCKIFHKAKFHQYVKMMEDTEATLRNVEGNCILNYYTLYKLEREIFPKEWFASTIDVPFENIVIPLPIGYHEYLTKLFGDYMTPPPIEKQVSHHSHYYCNLREHLNMDEIRQRIKKGERYVY